jgi:hypothetical protein
MRMTTSKSRGIAANILLAELIMHWYLSTRYDLWTCIRKMQ